MREDEQIPVILCYNNDEPGMWPTGPALPASAQVEYGGHMAYEEDADFLRTHAEHQLEVMDRQCMTIRTRHKLTLEARRTSRFFQRPYTWTGSGIEKDPEIISGSDDLGHATHRLHGPIIRSGTKRIFIIDLGREYQSGETVEVEFKQTLLDL